MLLSLDDMVSVINVNEILVVGNKIWQKLPRTIARTRDPNMTGERGLNQNNMIDNNPF